MSEHHQEGLAHLLYGINHGGGFVALTGEVGTGKTTLCHCLLQQLPENVEIALVLNPKLTAIELLATICDELHIAYEQNKQTLKGLIDGLNNYLLSAHAKGKRTVLVIDEAQNLSLGVLEQVRLLTNLETSTTKLLQIILLGQPELKQLLEKPALRQLNQRITARYHLTPLSYVDTRQYIQHRLKVSGGDPYIFNRRALKKIYSLSKGVPRLINILCDRALLGAYVDGRQAVSVKMINKAAKEVFGSEKIADRTTFVIGFLFIILLGLVASFLPKSSKPNRTVLPDSFTKPAAQIDIPQLSIELKKDIIKDEELNFQAVLENNKVSSLAAKVPRLAKLWGKEIKQGEGCKEVEAVGLACLFDQAQWEELIALNRPVIMEISFTESKKSYALLIELDEQQNPVFAINNKTSFPLQQVLKYWNGYYLMIWQPPLAKITTVYPNRVSDATLWIRRHLGGVYGEGNANLFDQSLKGKVIEFQKKMALTPDGIVGPRTFIHLQNTNPLDVSPKLNQVH